MTTLKERTFNRTVYHAGDFKRKAESLRQLNNGRSTGFFGTGHYFTTRPERCERQGGGTRPIYAIDVSGYNLILGSLELHRTLKDLNRYVSWYPLVRLDTDAWHKVIYYSGMLTAYGKSIAESLRDSFETFGESPSFIAYASSDSYVKSFIEACEGIEWLRPFVKALKKTEPNWALLKELEEDTSLFNHDVYDRVTSVKRSLGSYAIDLRCSEDRLRDLCESVYRDLERYYRKEYLVADLVEDSLDSIPTRILRALGYDGVYPDEDTDNISYGGVLYELDQEDVSLHRPGA